MVTRTLTELIREVDPDFDSDPPPVEYRFRGGRIFRALPGRGAYDGTIYATEIQAEQGYFFFQGQDAGLFPSSYILPVTVGSFTQTGGASAFSSGLAAGIGSFTLTGQPASLLLGTQFLPAEVGSFTQTGVASAFSNTLAASTGTYTLTGNDAALSTRAADSIAADLGTFTLTGANAIFLGASGASAGSFTMTGRAASLDRLLSQTFATMDAGYTPTNGTDLVTRAKLVDMVNEAMA